MKVLIIEDEEEASDRLQMLLQKYDSQIQIAETLPSVEDTVAWLQSQPAPDLIFMDIHLADGLSFEIFELLNVQSPVIFTTAYDQYTLKAFKLNSIDYLLKPINYQEMVHAIEKYKNLYEKSSFNFQHLADLLKSPTKAYKSRFLVKSGNKMTFVVVEQIAYFQAVERVVFLVTKDNKQYLIDDTLESLEEVLNPQVFFRINRTFIVHIQAIQEIEPYFNSRLVVFTTPTCKETMIVSRPKVAAFKNWLDN